MKAIKWVKADEKKPKVSGWYFMKSRLYKKVYYFDQFDGKWYNDRHAYAEITNLRGMKWLNENAMI
jgi:hypothetical protein